MARVCQVTGKNRQVGNNVSHSQRKTKRTFEPNLQWRRFWSPNLNKYVRLRIASKGLKIIDKYGIDHVLNMLNIG